jgi:hypothetical protein
VDRGPQLDFPLLGVPLSLTSNDPAVLQIARRAFAAWTRLPARLVLDRPPLPLEVRVEPGAAGSGAGGAYDYQLEGDTLRASAPGVELTARRGEGALAVVSAGVVAEQGPALRRNVLECMALFLATGRRRTPVHAAAVVGEAGAVLLCGPSGAGKSTLSYGLFCRGFSLLAEDAVYVELRQPPRLWGNPAGFSLCPSAARGFPELSGVPATVQPNGKLKVNVPLDGQQNRAKLLREYTGRVVVCQMLRTGRQQAALERIPAARAAELLARPLDQGFDLAQDLDAVRRWLAGCPSCLLQVGRDPRDSIDLIQELVRE